MTQTFYKNVRRISYRSSPHIPYTILPAQTAGVIILLYLDPIPHREAGMDCLPYIGHGVAESQDRLLETDYFFLVKALLTKCGWANGFIGEVDMVRLTDCARTCVSRSKVTNSSNVASCCMARFMTISYIAFREGALNPLVLLFIMLSYVGRYTPEIYVQAPS